MKAFFFSGERSYGQIRAYCTTIYSKVLAYRKACDSHLYVTTLIQCCNGIAHFARKLESMYNIDCEKYAKIINSYYGDENYSLRAELDETIRLLNISKTEGESLIPKSEDGSPMEKIKNELNGDWDKTSIEPSKLRGLIKNFEDLLSNIKLNIDSE